jgi:kinesin family protein 4/21/27
MQKEMKILQAAKKKHAELLRKQTQDEDRVKTLKNDLAEMKRAKVELLNKMKEEAAKHKDVELHRNREIAQLRKESQKKDNTIQSLQAEKRVKEAVLKRKQKKVTALRKMQHGPLSNNAAGIVGPGHFKFLRIYDYLFKICVSLQIFVINGSFCHCHITSHYF